MTEFRARAVRRRRVPVLTRLLTWNRFVFKHRPTPGGATQTMKSASRRPDASVAIEPKLSKINDIRYVYSMSARTGKTGRPCQPW